MSLFPFFVDITGKTALLIGGGRIALHKARKLEPFGARLIVIAPDILPELEALPNIETVRRAFEPEDIGRYRPFFVIAATDDRSISLAAAKECERLGIPINAVDDRELCTFQFPALVSRGSLTVGISTAGKSPTAAASIRALTERILPEDTDALLDGMEALREKLKQTVPEQKERAAILRRCWDYALAHGTLPEDSPKGFVSLVGGGCGKADLISLRGMRRLTACEAVVYDALVDPALLSLAPEGARLVPVGKRAGKHSASQSEINETLIALAKEGLDVVRLKGGDPYLFGRGGEEAEALTANGIPWEEIPGITSAIAIPAEHGIPVTHRNVSRGVHIITAHTAADGLPQDLPILAKLSGTLVFLMGLGKLGELAEGLMKNGRSPETPAAVVSGGSAKTSYCVRGTLSDIAENASGAEPPAVIVVGDVAAFDLRG